MSVLKGHTVVTKYTSPHTITGQKFWLLHGLHFSIFFFQNDLKFGLEALRRACFQKKRGAEHKNKCVKLISLDASSC